MDRIQAHKEQIAPLKRDMMSRDGRQEHLKRQESELLFVDFGTPCASTEIPQNSCMNRLNLLPLGYLNNTISPFTEYIMMARI